MKQTLFRWAAAAATITAGVLISSCAYDPYYSDGYGYSGGSYSSSVFISTGDSRWGYDPYCHSYYDYHRRAYYDPFLYSYYPVGYRPPVVYGVPHPHGWSPGRGYCPPPSRVRNTTLSNYRDRESLYRRSNFSWASQARQRDSGSSFQPRADFGRPSGRDGGSRDPRSTSGGSSRFDNDSRPVQRQFPGFDSSRGRADREDSRNRSGFTRPPERSGGFDRPQVIPDRRSSPDRSQFQGRPQFQERSRENRRPSPSGFNNPVTLAPERSAPRIERTPPQRIAPPQQEARPAPTREFSRPERSGGSSREGGGGGREFRGRGRD